MTCFAFYFWIALAASSFCGHLVMSLEETTPGLIQKKPTTHEIYTLYHLNSHRYGSDPTNMDLGDLAGDLFFDIFEILTAFPCARNDTQPLPFEVVCHNPEVFGQNIFLTQLQVKIDTTNGFGTYSRCNVCVNGTTPFTHETCQSGSYVCECHDEEWKPVPCTDFRVGREEVNQYFSAKKQVGAYCNHTDPSNENRKILCASTVAGDRIQGFWYSTLDIGKQKTWEVHRVLKTVDRKCHQASFLLAVQSRGDASCFEACASPNHQTGTSSVPNITDPCYAECFVRAALGPDSLNSSTSNGGMTKEKLMDAWSRPFASSDMSRGGCPDVGGQWGHGTRVASSLHFASPRQRLDR